MGASFTTSRTPVQPDGSQAYTSECRAAIITEVDAEDPSVIGLCVLNPTGQFFNRGVAHDEGDEHDAGRWGGTWHWPERI